MAEAQKSGKPACLDVTIASLPAPVYTAFGG